MNEITNINNKLSLGKFYFDKTGLTVTGDPTFEEWENCGKFLKQAEKSVQFWIGDWLNYGEKHYGETYTQALDETDYEEKTLRNAKYVSSKIDLSRRRDNLSFSHHAEVAALPPDEQEYWLEKAEAEGLSRTDLRQAIKHEKLIKSANEMPDGKYLVIYADPPWQYDNSGFDESAEDQYPTMDIQSICDLNVSKLCTDETVLFLWATNPLLPEALRVVESWGFTYKTNMAWIKDKGRGKGWFLKSKHELLIIATRENSPHPMQRPDSCFEADRGSVHSRKPEIVYEIIESMYPGNKIELFARNIAPRKGWVFWGNQL